MKIPDKSELLARSIERLEFPELLKYLSQLCRSEPGKNLALSLKPEASLSEIKREYELLSQMLSLLETIAPLPLGYFTDLFPVLESARLGKTLSGKELREILNFLNQAGQVRGFFKGEAKRFQALVELAKGIADFRWLRDSLEKTVDEQGEVKPEASSRLASLTSELASSRREIQKTLDALLCSAQYKSIFQDTFYTEREGRFVLPVKAQEQGKFPGLVHDTSSSGATVYMEPLELVPLNNRLRMLAREIEAEKLRILKELSQKIAGSSEQLISALDSLVKLDLIQAKAELAIRLKAVVPEVVEEPILELYQIRHPLLVLEGKEAIANDLVLEPEVRVLVISGPNTGGKTVFLKTIGLLVLMVRAGLAIPVHPDSRLGFFPEVYALFGDEQSLSADLSSYSAHLASLLGFLKSARQNSLVLIDEILASTDPEEASALALVLLRQFRERNCLTFTVTHFSRLKLLAETEPGFKNASFEFDQKTLSPTYKINIGIPGPSYGIFMAKKLGLESELVQKAQELLEPERRNFQNLIARLNQKAFELEQKTLQLREKENQLQALEKKLKQEKELLAEKETQLKQEFRRKLESELRIARQELDRLMEQAKRESSRESIRRAEKKISQLKRELEEHYPHPLPKEASFSSLNPGDWVWVKRLNARAKLLELDGEQALLALGTFRIRENIRELVKLKIDALDSSKFSAPEPESSEPIYIPPSPSNTLDLRGKRVDEAEIELVQYLDRSLREGKPMVYIIHGHGTGALKKMVRDYLKDSPYAREFRPGQDYEGGDGVTVVFLEPERSRG